MRVETVSFDGSSWSAPLPAMDSAQTLVVVFGASELVDDQRGIAEVFARFGSSHVIGCSSAGEIVGTKVSDGGLAVAIVQFDATSLATAFASVGEASQSHGAGEEVGRVL